MSANKPQDRAPKAQRNLVISTMKDEGPYLLEWVAWYRAIGFTDILVYTNDCTDGTDLMLQRLEHLGVIKHEHNEVLRRGPHKSALKYAMEHPLYHAADWVFVGDADEFLNIHVGQGHIEDLKAAYPDADVIPVVWRPFSSNGETQIRDAMVTKIMTDAAPLPDGAANPDVGFIKTLFRVSDDISHLGLHRPFFKDGSQERWALAPPSDEDPLRLVGELGLETAQVNHYAVRSAQSFMIKRDRGRANHTSNRLDPNYWLRWNAGGTPDQSILRNHAAHRAEYDRLRQDPVLTEMHNTAIKTHRQRAKNILQNDPEAQVVYHVITQIMPKLEQENTQVPLHAQGKRFIIQKTTRTPLPDSLTTQPLASPTESEQIIQNILAEYEQNLRAPKRRKVRQTMLDKDIPKGGRAAEIGVWQGTFSAEILNITRPRELVLIDPWDLLAPKITEHTHTQHAQTHEMRAKYLQVMRTLGRIPNCIVRKGFSADVLKTYPDTYFDWVYIDGNHLYDFVLEDILIAARKVRPGGVIAGDDLYWKRDGRHHVKEAVHDAIAQLADRARLTTRGAQFIIKLAE